MRPLQINSFPSPDQVNWYPMREAPVPQSKCSTHGGPVKTVKMKLTGKIEKIEDRTLLVIESRTMAGRIEVYRGALGECTDGQEVEIEIT